MKREIELWTAFGWTCDDCGRDNFARGVNVGDELAESLVPDDDREAVAGVPGGWVMAPDDVTCAHCGAKFDVADD